ncbi:MAG: hypothetical protein ACK4F6_06955 [Hylemonella sp.]
MKTSVGALRTLGSRQGGRGAVIEMMEEAADAWATLAEVMAMITRVVAD